MLNSLNEWWANVISKLTWWAVVGFCGQLMFTMRFLIQWLVSEKKQESTIPLVFWYFSLGGGAILLVYAIHIADPVIILGQATGLVVYTRNLMLIGKKKRKDKERRRTPHPMMDS